MVYGLAVMGYADFFMHMCEEESLLEHGKNIFIVLLYRGQNKDNKNGGKNCIGFSGLSIPWKVFGRIMLERLQEIMMSKM